MNPYESREVGTFVRVDGLLDEFVQECPAFCEIVSAALPLLLLAAQKVDLSDCHTSIFLGGCSYIPVSWTCRDIARVIHPLLDGFDDGLGLEVFWHLYPVKAERDRVRPAHKSRSFSRDQRPTSEYNTCQAVGGAGVAATTFASAASTTVAAASIAG